MDKKEIYEHLAKIYLDASSKKKKRTKTHLRLYNNLFIIGLILVIGSGTALVSFSSKKNNLSSETALFLTNDPSKVNFNFNPAKKESFIINLNRLDLSHFKKLAFSIKNTDPKDILSLRIEFTNTFKEKSAIYLRNVPGKWQEFKIAFLDFKNITNWSEMANISFSVEEWNAQKDKGVLYIDSVRFLK
jgi:hypothetical protein